MTRSMPVTMAAKGLSQKPARLMLELLNQGQATPDNASEEPLIPATETLVDNESETGVGLAAMKALATWTKRGLVQLGWRHSPPEQLRPSILGIAEQQRAQKPHNGRSVGNSRL